MRFDNGQISGRQCRRALLLELFGVSVFLMTGLLAATAGSKSFFMLLAGGVLVLLGVWFYWWLARDLKDAYGVVVHQTFPRAGKWIAVLYLVRLTFRGGFVLSICYRILREFLLKDTTFSYIVVPLLLLCGYSAVMGREKRMRTLELLFWFVFAAFALALVLVVKDMDASNLVRKSEALASRAYPPAFLIPVALYSNVEFLLFLLPVVRNRDRSVRNVLVPAAAALACNFFLLLLSVGVLGSKGCQTLEWPALRVLQSAKVPGGFLERLDILLVAFWLFAVFSVVSGCIFYSGEMLQYNCHVALCGDSRWCFVPGMLLSYLFGLWFEQMEGATENFLFITLCVDLPLGIVLALWILRGPIKKSAAAALLLTLTLLCSGCGSMTDVEKWDYVLTLGVDAANGKGGYVYSFGISESEESDVQSVAAASLEEAIEKYGKTHDKALQIGHLDAVVLGQSVYTGQTQRQEVIDELRAQSRIPIATRVYGVQTDARKAMEQRPDETCTLGEYLDELIANNEPEREDFVALKNLYDAGTYSLVVFRIENQKVTGQSLFKIQSQG